MKFVKLNTNGGLRNVFVVASSSVINSKHTEFENHSLIDLLEIPEMAEISSSMIYKKQERNRTIVHFRFKQEIFKAFLEVIEKQYKHKIEEHELVYPMRGLNYLLDNNNIQEIKKKGWYVKIFSAILAEIDKRWP